MHYFDFWQRLGNLFRRIKSESISSYFFLTSIREKDVRDIALLCYLKKNEETWKSVWWNLKTT